MSTSNSEKIKYFNQYSESIVEKIEQLKREGASRPKTNGSLNVESETLDNDNSLFVLEYINIILKHYQSILENPKNQIIINDIWNKLPDPSTENDAFIRGIVYGQFLDLDSDYKLQSYISEAMPALSLSGMLIGVVAILLLVAMPGVAMGLAVLGIIFVGVVGIVCSLSWGNQISRKESASKAIVELEPFDILARLDISIVTPGQSTDAVHDKGSLVAKKIKESFFNKKREGSDETLHQEVNKGAKPAAPA